MQYVRLGRSGIRVSRICLGSAAFGVVPREADAQALVDKALSLGINFFDTATSYGNRSGQDRPGVPPAAERKSAEEILGQTLKGRRDDVIIATKVQERVGTGVNDGGADGGGLSRYHIMKRLELSLERLQTDHIDIYHAHHPDPTTPLEESLRTFDDLVRQGMVRYIALSGFPGWQVANVMWKADKFNLDAPICHQVQYSLTNRSVERETIPASLEYGLDLTCFTAIGGGLLAGTEFRTSRPIAELGMQRWRQGQGSGFTAAEVDAADQLDAVSGEWGIPAAQLALGWVLSKPSVACAIIGPETPEEVEESVPAAELELSADQLKTLDEIGKA